MQTCGPGIRGFSRPVKGRDPLDAADDEHRQEGRDKSDAQGPSQARVISPWRYCYRRVCHQGSESLWPAGGTAIVLLIGKMQDAGLGTIPLINCEANAYRDEYRCPLFLSNDIGLGLAHNLKQLLLFGARHLELIQRFFEFHGHHVPFLLGDVQVGVRFLHSFASVFAWAAGYRRHHAIFRPQRY